MKIIHTLALALLLPLVSFGCDDESSSNGNTDDGEPGETPSDTLACEAVEPTCQDQSILELTLFTEVSPRSITDESVDEGTFLTHVDTVGGGLEPTESYVYARFTDDGLVKVDVSDEQALESMEWDIAFRRFVVRVNSGVSGPSCVGVAATESGTLFDDLNEVSDDLEFLTESYYDDQCVFVSGHPFFPTPATQAVSFWEYPVGCVQMTGNVFVLSLANERHVKFEVLSYYSLDNQAECDETGVVPQPSEAGNLRIKWEFLN